MHMNQSNKHQVAHNNGNEAATKHGRMHNTVAGSRGAANGAPL